MSWQVVPNNDWMTFDVTQLVKDWKGGTYPNHGVKIVGRYNSGDQVKAFKSSDYTDGAFRPKLTVQGTYDAEVIPVVIFATSTSVTESYDYDAIGNVITKSAQGTYEYAGTNYANPHALTSITGIASSTFAYDNNGNLTSGGGKSLTWDYANRLATVTVGATTTTYGYDHNDQRVKKVSGGITTLYPNKYFEVQGATTTAYIWAGDDLIATVAKDGVSTTTEYIHEDHLGSTNVTTDATGGIVSVIDYYPFGEERISTGNSSTDRHFIGERFDAETEMSYLNARYYDGGRGQFTSQDPVFRAVGNPGEIKNLTKVDQNKLLMDPQALNSYSYARNNPIRYSDPEGLWFKEFATGQQSFSDFQVEVGQATQYMTDNSRAWSFAVDHPYTTGAVVGFASAGAAQAGLYGTVALKAAAYPGVGTAYSASRIAEGAAYLYLAQNSLNNISNLLGQLSEFDPKNPTFNSSAKLIYNFGVEGASTFGGERVGGIADTYNLISSALNDISKSLNKLKESLNKSSNKDKKK